MEQKKHSGPVAMAYQVWPSVGIDQWYQSRDPKPKELMVGIGFTGKREQTGEILCRVL